MLPLPAPTASATAPSSLPFASYRCFEDSSPLSSVSRRSVLWVRVRHRLCALMFASLRVHPTVALPNAGRINDGAALTPRDWSPANCRLQTACALLSSSAFVARAAVAAAGTDAADQWRAQS